MKLYIGNATRQVIDFKYWVPGVKSPRSQIIPIGGQIMVGGSTSDWSQADIDKIVAQHVVYGLVSLAEADKQKSFSGMCWSVDQPIPPHKLMRLIDLNQGLLKRRGEEIQKMAALASAQRLQNDLQEQQIPENLTTLETSVAEVDPPNDGSYQPVGEGVRVELSNTDDGAPKTPRLRGRRAA